MGWDHWTTAPLEHRSESGANNISDISDKYQVCPCFHVQTESDGFRGHRGSKNFQGMVGQKHKAEQFAQSAMKEL